MKKNFYIGIIFLFVSFVNVLSTEVNTAYLSDIPQKILQDWMAADSVDSTSDFSTTIEKIRSSMSSPEYSAKIESGNTIDAYKKACHWRRASRLVPYLADDGHQELKKILFARHHNLDGDIIGFLEEMNTDGFVTNMGKWGTTSCVSKPASYASGGALLSITMNTLYPVPETVIEDNFGVIKDPCVSFDGKKVVFAWSKDNNGYHLWETEIENPERVRQLTDNPEGLAVSDYEPCYLQNGDIIFNSSRCFGFVECYYNMTSNFFLINRDGKYLRRIGYDQVHTFYPTLMSDGKVLYSRWEYQDRNVLDCFGLFTMNPDGTEQIEYFGNQTEWPATIIHARQIPGTQKIMAVISGHKAPYSGDLVIISADMAKNGSSVVDLVAPRRPKPKISSIDFGGNVDNYNFQKPFPLDNESFLVSWRPVKDSNFAIYLMDIDGGRELLAWDDNQSLSSPMSMQPKNPPPVISYKTDYEKDYAVVTLHDAYYGTGTGSSVEKGTIKKVRVVSLEYRTDPAFGNTGSQGYQMTPVGRWTASWEAKRIVGEMKIEEDGSAAFEVPARTPLYLQLVDDKGRMIQTMRSWMTLQPGETFGCFGCHEDRTEAPSSSNAPIARIPKKLDRFYDIDSTGYFSYPKYVQPILDKNCVKSGCHDKDHKSLVLTGDKVWTGTLDADNRNACRFWNLSYINLTDLSKQYVNFIDVNTSATGLPPNSVGSQKSNVMNMLLKGHHDVALSAEEFEKMALWIDLCIPHSGTYTDDMRETDAEKYRMRLERRKKHEELEEKNIREFIAAGGYKSYSNENSVKEFNDRDNNAGLKRSASSLYAAYNPGTRCLSLKMPAAGSVSLIDMNGRRLLKIDVDNTAIKKNAGKIHLPCSVGAGIYIVKYTGTVPAQEKILTVL